MNRFDGDRLGIGTVVSVDVRTDADGDFDTTG